MLGLKFRGFSLGFRVALGSKVQKHYKDFVGLVISILLHTTLYSKTIF